MEKNKPAGPGLPSALLVLGALTAAAGVAMLCLPAGLIALGALSMAAGVLMIRGGGT